jgi:integrase
MKPKDRRTITERVVRGLKPREKKYLTHDKKIGGLAVEVQPTGRKTWKFIYANRGRPRWFTIGRAGEGAISVEDAKSKARRLIGLVADGRDPMAEKRAERTADTFDKLYGRYVEEHAKVRNKSWKQADDLIKKHVLPRWEERRADDIKRSDVRELMGSLKATPVVANQVKAAASAVFSWGMREEAVANNPCKGVGGNPTRSRDRVLADEEVPLFWKAFDDTGPVNSYALKVLLLTGQRPGEVSHMRKEHVKDGWWTLPGDPVAGLKWPGTKNKKSHRVWLPRVAQELIDELNGGSTGFVFANDYGNAVNTLSAAMKAICAKLGVERATPHDLRRTHGTTITKLKFGRDAMNRIQNHKDGGIADVYDIHNYADENQQIMEAVARRIMALVEGGRDDTVVAFRK